jgi:multidrug resistance protein
MLTSAVSYRPFASSMFAPAIPLVASELSISNAGLATFTVSVYLLGYAVGPLLLAPLSELYGRSPVYLGTTLLFIVGNVACALSSNTAMLIVFRFWTGCFGAGPLTIGPASVGDCFAQAERGRAMAVWTMPVLLGPCLGPAVGSYAARALGWRWLFWMLCIAVSQI